MVSGSTDFAFLGYVPLMSARWQGLPVKVVANADNGAETAKDEWTLLLSKKGSPIKKPADLAGKTIAVNALKGVGEVEIKAALDKRGVDPELDQAARDPVPGDAGRARQGPRRRDLGAGAVPDLRCSARAGRTSRRR